MRRAVRHRAIYALVVVAFSLPFDQVGSASAAAPHSALEGCAMSSEPAPVFPLPEVDLEESLISGETLAKVMVGFRFTEEHQIDSGEALVRTAAELTGGSSGIQALYFDTENSRHEWNEFLWQDPEWSERNSTDDWSTRTEPGAFEPQYRFSYFVQLTFPTTMASLLHGLVFEGATDSQAGRLYRYGSDSMGGLSSIESAIGRFAVHPDGYVVEMVVAGQAAADSECWESTLAVSPDLDVRGVHDEPPVDWMTDLSILSSCQKLLDST